MNPKTVASLLNTHLQSNCFYHHFFKSSFVYFLLKRRNLRSDATNAFSSTTLIINIFYSFPSLNLAKLSWEENDDKFMCTPIAVMNYKNANILCIFFKNKKKQVLPTLLTTFNMTVKLKWQILQWSVSLSSSHVAIKCIIFMLQQPNCKIDDNFNVIVNSNVIRSGKE